MPITQKRVYNVILPTNLQRLLAIEDHTPSTLKDLRQELCNFGNEIGEVLGVYEPAKNTLKPKQKIGKTLGTPEQKNQIFKLLKEHGRMNSKQIAKELGLIYCVGANIMTSLYNSKLVVRSQNPDTKYREFLYELPPSGIDVVSIPLTDKTGE